MECLGQFDSAMVQADRDGLLANPAYLAELPSDHVLNRNQNVFAFSAAAAAEQVLAALRMIVAPSGVADVGAQTFHFTTGTVDLDVNACDPGCLSTSMITNADPGERPTGFGHKPAQDARSSRGESSWSVVEVRPLPDRSRTTFYRQLCGWLRGLLPASRGGADEARDHDT